MTRSTQPDGQTLQQLPRRAHRHDYCGDTSWWRLRHPRLTIVGSAIAALLMLLSISACGPQPIATPNKGTPAPEQPTPSPNKGTPAPEQPTPSPNKGTPAPEQPTPSQGETPSWVMQAVTVCIDVYNSRGRPPRAQSLDFDDDMALYENWHHDLATKAADALAAIPDTPTEGASLIDGMRTYASLSLQIAKIYSDHAIISSELQPLQAQRGQAVKSVQSLAESLGIQPCGQVVNPPE